ncbi:MFS transporter [Lichenifustis flavocetrariae]|uniref:MFS transporter n=1 Tax=Lichenifustis flavocetrariae TaxID=2949735 RepID=A0AA42CMM6_9HYPH|nr:MFS transporter [Lichenifustis flavocetrariae]MCW6512693.1 MFS transporter [Lichenifustis flavocetrariae]
MTDVALDATEPLGISSTPVTARRATLILLAMAVGSFGIGTGEFAIMGLLPDIAAGLGVSVPTAGHLISAYALGVVVGAPMIALLAAKLSRRTLLLLLMLAFGLGNLASAVAPDMLTLTGARFLSGLPHGAYFGVAALVAASVAGPGRRAQSVGRVLLGLTVATLLGTPLVAWLGQHFGWRSLFVLVGALGIVTVLLLWLTLPQDEVHDDASALRELGALMRPQVWLTFAFAAVGLGGMFAAFSYIASTTTLVAGLPTAFVPMILAIFGAGMVLGNLLGAWLADRSLMKTIGGVLTFNIMILVIFAVTASHPVMLCLCVFFIGFGVALAPAVQTRLMDVAGDAQTLAAASMHSAFNIANAAGAWLGGAAITAGFGFASTGWVGACLGVAGLVVFGISWRLDRKA